ncbi:MAG: hypothetical protein PHU05_00760 [Bacilli bacterium]|nr:hypothetical protein [Bacilli bacterium]
MDKYMVLIVTKKEELQQINDLIEQNTLVIDGMYQENQARKQQVINKTKDIERYQGMKAILQNEKQIKKTGLIKALLAGGSVASLVVATNLIGLSSADLIVLAPSSLLSLLVYSYNTSEVKGLKEKYSISSLEQLIEDEQEDVLQIRSKAKEVTEEIIRLRNDVSAKRQQSSIMNQEINNLSSIRDSIIESVYDEIIEQHITEHGIQQYNVKPMQKVKRRD